MSQTKDQRYHTVQNSNYLYFQKEKKFNIWKFSPAGRGVNWKEQDWLLCRRQVRYKQLSNLGLGGFSHSINNKISFSFLFFLLCYCYVYLCFFFFFRKRSGGDEIKSEKNAKKHFPQYLKTENHSSCQDSMNSG